MKRKKAKTEFDKRLLRAASTEPGMVRRLLEEGANVDITNTSGTPLLHIVFGTRKKNKKITPKERMDAIEAIIGHADFSSDDLKGIFAVIAYHSQQRKSIAEDFDESSFLLKNGAKASEDDLYRMSMSGAFNDIIALTNNGVSPDSVSKNNFGESYALGVAACNDHTDTIIALVDAGAYPNVRSDLERYNGEYLMGAGYTPLHWTVARGNIAATTFLLEHGADPTIVDISGRTPLGVRRFAQSNRIDEMVASAISLFESRRLLRAVEKHGITERPSL